MVKVYVFISYLNDDNKVVSGIFELVNVSESLISFKTNSSLISIPVSRVLKIKRKFASIKVENNEIYSESYKGYKRLDGDKSFYDDKSFYEKNIK